jgi:hypothetical protein
MNTYSSACCIGIPPSSGADKPISYGVLFALIGVYAATALVAFGALGAQFF